MKHIKIERDDDTEDDVGEGSQASDNDDKSTILRNPLALAKLLKSEREEDNAAEYTPDDVIYIFS